MIAIAKSQFCHFAAKKCCGSGNLLIWCSHNNQGCRWCKVDRFSPRDILLEGLLHHPQVMNKETRLEIFTLVFQILKMSNSHVIRCPIFDIHHNLSFLIILWVSYSKILIYHPSSYKMVPCYSSLLPTCKLFLVNGSSDQKTYFRTRIFNNHNAKNRFHWI